MRLLNFLTIIATDKNKKLNVNDTNLLYEYKPKEFTIKCKVCGQYNGGSVRVP
jgi:hypothetical protein